MAKEERVIGPLTFGTATGNPIEEEPEIETVPGIEGSPMSPEAIEQITEPKKTTKKKTVVANQGLKNADINFNEYGDDSSAPNQAQAGGMNEKYTGEGVKTSNINYDPNAELSNLDPNYQYGMSGQYANSDSAGYLARRNDQIASALWNEYKGDVTKENVVQYLASQNGWNNSTEADRVNTVESVWKRLGQLASENQQSDAEQPQGDNSPDESGLNKMESDLMKDTGGEIYGKTGPDRNGRVETLVDDNSIYTAMAESRLAKLKSLVYMSDAAIAASVYSGSGIDIQAYRDFQQYYPDRYALVQEEVKRLRGQDTINAITNGTTDYGTGINTSSLSSELTSYAVNNATNTTTATQLLQSINSILESNNDAASAKALMQSIENDMATLKNRLSNLRKEANQIFRGDTPQYIVSAYINNRTQEIQNQMSILEDRYNAAYTRYQGELDEAWKQKEYDLKKRELELKEQAADLNDYATREGIAIDWYKAKGSTTVGNYTVAERNNNPTNMTVDFMEIVGAELGVDYEIGSDSFINSNGRTQYYAKLIGDPVETTIRILDKAIANGVNPFTTTSWSYINQLGLTKDKWLNMSQEEKEAMVKKWVNYEGGDISNMAYYVGRGTTFDTRYGPAYEKYLSGDYSQAWLNSQAKSMNISTTDFASQARAYMESQEAESELRKQELMGSGNVFVRRDGEVFEYSSQYAALNDDDRDTVEGLLNLQVNPAWLQTRYGYSQGQSQKLTNAAISMNPKWTQDSYGEMVDMKDDWGSLALKGANDKNATAVTIAKELYEAADQLGNGKLKDWNHLINLAKTKMSDAEYGAFLANIGTFVDEASTAMKGGNAAATDTDRQELRNRFSADLGKDALKAMILQMAKNLYEKNETQAYMYRQRTLEKPLPIWTPEATEWLYNVVGTTTMPKYYDYTPELGGVTYTNPGTLNINTGAGSSIGNNAGTGSTTGGSSSEW